MDNRSSVRPTQSHCISMKNKKLTIALDFDGVIANAGELKRMLASELIGKRVTLYEASGERVRAGKSILTEREWDIIKEKTYFDRKAIERLKPVPHSIPTIQRWLRAGHIVKVVTARTSDMRDDAIRWLRKHDVDIPVVGAGPRMTKVPHLSGCDIFVDDDADRALEAQAVCRAYFFKWPYNDRPKGVRSTSSLKHIRLESF